MWQTNGRAGGASPVLAYGPDMLGSLPGVVAATQAADLPAEVQPIDPRRFAVWAAAFGSDGREGGSGTAADITNWMP